MTAVSGAASATFVYDGDGNRVKGVLGGVTTTYIGNYFEWSGSTSMMKKYYYAGGTRVAERKGTTLYWLLSDHLGSTSITATSSGSKTAELRYKAWGETRYTYGTTPTSQRYTGQREESSLGLYWYASRWYSPYLNRFLSPDSIIPDPTNPLVWDRYSYSHNNPINYVDPTGHKACSPTIDGGCDTFEEEVLKLIEKIVDAIESTSKDDDNDGYPETPDKNAPPVSIGTTPGCSQGTYVECFYSRDLLDIFTKMKIDQKQMASLVVAVYYDLNKRSRGLQDRAAYDTPFWDFYGEAPGDACYGGHCFKRQEINYFAQGMYTNANGESRLTGLGTVYAWKMLKYGEMPSDGTLLWFDLGYLMYSIIQEGQ